MGRGRGRDFRLRSRIEARNRESMFCRALASFIVCVTAVAAFGVQSKPQIMPEDQVKAGMHGVAYTVFEGTKPEAMDVEILGVLRDMAGPKSDVILARLHGDKVEYT